MGCRQCLLFDLESVDIAKGFSSPLLGSNNGLAGTINLKTAKPVKNLDFKAKYTNYFDSHTNDQGRLMGFSLGTRQEKFYAKISAVENRRDFYRLSGDFGGGRYQDKGRRVNSDYRNRSVNAIVGFTPTRDIDVMFGYTAQRYERGQPINASPDAPDIGNKGNQTRAWRWPIYDTDRLYMNASWNINEKAKAQFIAYYDKHKDKTYSYQDADYSIRDLSGDTLYDQYTAGAQIKLDYAFNSQNNWPHRSATETCPTKLTTGQTTMRNISPATSRKITGMPVPNIRSKCPIRSRSSWAEAIPGSIRTGRIPTSLVKAHLA